MSWPILFAGSTLKAYRKGPFIGPTGTLTRVITLKMAFGTGLAKLDKN